MLVTLERIQHALSGRYRVLSELGRGGMAAVFLAEDEPHGRRVAVKVLEPDLAAAIGAERFKREIRITARLSHPHIVPLLDSGEAEGLCYYVMPEVEGETLHARLEREPQLPVEEALRITREIAGALSYAHARLLVHRDVKPANIFLAQSHALLADFGIARLAGTGPFGRLTTTGVMVGTPAYMSPEQVAGGSGLDARADQYALACVTYEMLAGQPPFTGPSAETVARQHLVVSPRPVTDLRPKVPQAISDSLERALSKSPADRFANVEDFARALGGGEVERAAAPAVPGTTTSRSHRLALAAIAAGAIALALGISWRSGRDRGPERLPPGASPAWILVAAFDGPPGDPEIGPAARQLVSAEIDQSRLMATVPPEQIALALKQAGKPDSTRITAAVARELAYRRSIRAVLEGSVARLGHGFTIVVRVSDLERDSTLLSEKAEARDEDDLIRALGGLGRRVKRRLGENGGSVRSTRELVDARTPSFEAYRLMTRWDELATRGDFAGSLDPARRALALDPQFAYLMLAVSGTFANLGMTDSARSYLTRADHLRDRLGDEDRYQLSGLMAASTGDYGEALRVFGEYVREFPGSYWAHGNYAALLVEVGRLREAYEENRRSMIVSPFGPGVASVWNNCGLLMDLGRVDEADRAADTLGVLSEPAATAIRLDVLLVRERWAAADSLAASRLGDPRFDSSLVGAFWLGRCRAKSAQGEFRAAAAAARAAARNAAAAKNRIRLGRALRAQAILAGVAPHCRAELPWDFPVGQNYPECITSGLLRAAAGDRGGAQEWLLRARSGSLAPIGWEDDGRVLLESWIASSEGRWSQAAELLGPATLRSCEFGNRDFPRVGARAVNWFRGRAYENCSRPDSAIACYERTVASLQGGIVNDYVCRVPARIRLVELYSARGDLESARRHWNVLARDVMNPDPELSPMMSDAHSALVSAEAMARTAKP